MVKQLVTLSLIKKEISNSVTEYDKVVFSAQWVDLALFRMYLGPEGRQRSFETALALLRTLFPKPGGSGNLYNEWAACYRYAQHVISLGKVATNKWDGSLNCKTSWRFCELLTRCQQ